MSAAADPKDRALGLAAEIDAAIQARFTQGERDATPEEREHEGQLGQQLLQDLEQVEPAALNGRFEEMMEMAEHVIARAEGRPRGLKKPRAPLTDLGNAECFARDHTHGLRYVPGVGWLTWDGRRWPRDEDGASMRAAKVTARSRRREGDELEADEAQKVYKWATASEAAARLRNMVSLAESEEPLIARVEELDADAFLFTLLNGALDLRTGELRPHRRGDMSSKLAAVDYDPDAKCPIWDRFLAEVVPDEQVRAYLQRAVGYSMTADTREQCLFILEGGGANGKSVFLETVAALLGEYATHTDPTTFMEGRGRGVRSDLARLRGARFLVGSEIERGSRFAEVMVKQMTGGDKIVASFLYKNEFEFRPTFKVWLGANALPEILGTDHAIWRRIRRVPFPIKIERPDKTLAAKLRDELPGILNWAVAGCLTWQRDGLGVPESVRTATQDYRRSQDTVRLFLEEACLLSDDARVTPTVLRGAYEAFCGRQGLHPVEPRAFVVSLEGHGLRQRKSGATRSWRGITVGGGT